MEQITSDMADVSVKDGKISFGNLPDEIIVRIAKEAFVNPFVDGFENTQKEKQKMAVLRHDITGLKSNLDEAKSRVKRSKKELEETKGSKMFAKTRLNLAQNVERTAESDLRRKKVALERKFNENKHNLLLMKRVESNFYDNPSNYVMN